MIKIDGKQYDETQFSPELQNYLTLRQEIQIGRTRHIAEIEKIDVLTEHYNKKIVELIKKDKQQKQNKENGESTAEERTIARIRTKPGAEWINETKRSTERFCENGKTQAKTPKKQPKTRPKKGPQTGKTTKKNLQTARTQNSTRMWF